MGLINQEGLELPSQFINILRYQTLRNILIETTGNADIELQLDYLLDLIGISDSIDSLLLTLENFHAVIFMTEKICQPRKWHRIKARITKSRYLCEAILAGSSIIKQKAIRLTERSGTRHNSSFRSRIKTSPLYATLSYLPENRLYLREYRQLQTQIFVIKLLVESHQGKLADELLDALTATRSIAAHKAVELLPGQIQTPENYLEALREINNDSHLPRIINFLEKGLSFSKTYNLKELERLWTETEKPTHDIDSDPSFIEAEIPKEGWPEIIEDCRAFDEENPPDPNSAIYIVANRNTPSGSRINQIRVATQVANAQAMDNQLFHFDWDRLNARDLKALLDFFEGRILNGRNDLIQIRGYIALMFAIGMSHDRLIKLFYGPAEQPTNTTSPRLFPNFKLELYSPGPKLTTIPTPIMQQQACPHATRINLTLPPYITAALQPLLELQSQKKGGLFNGTSQELLQQATRTINKLKSATGTRLTLTRIEHFMERHLANIPQCDITKAALTLGKDLYLARTKIHYGAFDAEELGHHYSQCCSDVAKIASRQIKPKIELLCAPPVYIGTPRRPRRQIVQELIERLTRYLDNQRNRIKTTQDLMRFHNTYTLYTAVFIAYSTGYRAVNRPYITEEMYDEPSGFAVIRDKDSKDFYHSHLAWLPPTCRRQLALYRTHIEQIKLLSPPFPSSQNSRDSKFFFLTENGQRETVSKSAIERHLEAWNFFLPANVQRHFLKSELQEDGCPAEIIEVMLGHWHHGQEGWAATSALHPYIYRKTLEQYLLPLTKQIGLHAIEGIRTLPRKTTLDITSLTKVAKKKKRASPKKKISTRDKKLLRDHPPGQAWFAVLTDYFRSQTADMAFKLEQIKVLKLIFRHAPELYQSKIKLDIPDTLLNTLLPKIKPKPMVVKTYHLRMNYLIDALEWGKANLGWSVNIPARPVYVPKPFNMVRPAIMRLMKIYRSAEKAFLADLESNSAPAKPEELGRILLSAILYSGIVQRHWVEALLRGILDKKIYQHQAILWVDLWKNPVESTKLRDLWEKQKNPTLYRRWIADQTTQFLLYRYLKHTDGKDSERSKKLTLEELYERMALHLQQTTGHHLPPLNKLLGAAGAWATLNLPSFLVAYAKGRTLSANLPDPAWYRTLSGKYLDLSIHRQPLPARGTGVETALITAADQTKLFTKLREPLKDSARKESQVAQTLQNYLLENALHGSTALSLLGRWAIRLLDKKVSEFEHRNKRLPERPSTVDNYLGCIGHEFLATAGNVDLEELEEEDYLSLVKAVVSQINGRRKTNKDHSAAKRQRIDYVIHRLNQFLGYLHAFESFPYLQVSRDQDQIVVSESGHVRAGLINHQEYRALLAELGWGNNRLSRYQKIAICIVILAFRTGMRFSEIWGLLLNDIQGTEILTSIPEILVQRNHIRKLKTESSWRRILQILLPPEEREFVLTWYRFRMTEIGSKNDMPLFTMGPLRSEPVDKPKLAALLRSVIKEVTGDADLNIHSFRHSFLNHFLTGILSNIDHESDIRNQHFQEFESKSEIFDNMNNALFENETSGRKALYAGAMLMGHSSPITGLESYFHLPEYLTAHYLHHPSSQPLLTGKAIQTLTGTSQATAYRIAKHQDKKLRRQLLKMSVEHTKNLRHPLSELTSVRPSNFVQLPEKEIDFDLALHKVHSNPTYKDKLRWPTSTLQISICELLYQRLCHFIDQHPDHAEELHALMGNQYKRHDRAIMTYQIDQARLALLALNHLNISVFVEHFPSRWDKSVDVESLLDMWSRELGHICLERGSHRSGRVLPQGAIRINMEEINVWGYRLQCGDKLSWLFQLVVTLIKHHHKNLPNGSPSPGRADC